MATRPDQRLQDVFRHRPFRLLWTSLTVSLIGDGVYLVAIAWQVLGMSKSATALSLVGISWVVPQLVLLPVAGVAADRLDRRTLLVAADAVRGVAVAAIGAAVVLGTVQLWQVYALVAVYGAGESFFAPAFGAVVPSIVPQELLVRANTMNMMVRPLSMRLLGPALGGVLVATAGPGAAILVDAVSFLASGAILLALPPTPPGVAVRPPAPVLAEVREGFAYVRSRSWLWGSLVASAVAVLFFFGPWQVLVPFVLKEGLRATGVEFGTVMAVSGIGAVGVALAVGRRGVPGRYMTFLYGMWGGCFLGLLAYAGAHHLWQAALAGVVVGGAFTAGSIAWTTILHRLVPPELQGRVWSLDWFVSISLVPLSLALTGPLATAFGATKALAMAGVIGAILLSAAAFLGPFRRLERTTALATLANAGEAA